LSEQQLTQLWQRTDRARFRFLRRMEVLTVRALQHQMMPIIAAVEARQRDPWELAAEYPIQQLFVSLYGTVGVSFARASYRSLITNPPKEELVAVETKDKTPDRGGRTIAENNSPDTELDGNWLRKMRQIALQQTVKIKGITDTTKQFVKTTLEKAHELGVDAAGYLKQKWNEVIKKRASVISVVETTNASNIGSLLGAKSAQQQIDKVWLSVRDSKVRDSHRHADGQAVGLDDLFIVNGSLLDAPGDSTHGAPIGETIRCRCCLRFQKTQL
jgi:hypothetical protein